MSLKHVILVILTEGPLTGYEITKEFDTVLGNFWHATHQQVYRELKKMADEGIVEFEAKPQTGKPDRKIYAINCAGREALRYWLEKPLPPSAVKNLLLVKLYACDDPEILRRHLADFTAECRRALQVYQQITQEYYSETVDEMDPAKRRAWFTLRYGVTQREAQLRWADELECVLLGLGQEGS